MTGLQQTYIDTSIASNRADFNKSDFDRLIAEKGREVILEKALECPCKGAIANQRSTCRNCGGTGWIYVNPKQTRMVLSALSVSTKLAPWSEEVRGTAAVTAFVEEELSYMDKITALDGESVYSEVIKIKQSGVNLFAYTTYNIKEIIFAGLYVNDTTKLTQLQPTQYNISGNAIRIIDTANVPVGSSITLRYKHAPTFIVIEFGRETMQTFKLEGEEKLQHMPVSAFAKRLHYQLKTTNLANDWLLDNSFEEGCSDEQPHSCPTLSNNSYDFMVVQGDTFEQDISILENQDASTSIVGRTYTMQVRNALNTLILSFTIGDGITIIAPNVVRLFKAPEVTELLSVGSYRYDLEEDNEGTISTILFGNFIVKQQVTI